MNSIDNLESIPSLINVSEIELKAKKWLDENHSLILL